MDSMVGAASLPDAALHTYSWRKTSVRRVGGQRAIPGAVRGQGQFARVASGACEPVPIERRNVDRERRKRHRRRRRGEVEHGQDALAVALAHEGEQGLVGVDEADASMPKRRLLATPAQEAPGRAEDGAWLRI